MPHKRLICSLVLFTAGLYADPITAETSSYCDKSPRPMRVTMRHIEANGVGYNQGYTTLEGFFAPWTNDWVPFLDVRGHIFNNGKPAVNAGLGLRYITDSNVFGINAYYDYRKTSRQHYNQISVGLEALGEICDFRINGYLPVGAKTSSFFDTRFDKFEHNTMILSRKREFAMKGANAEIGAHVDTFENAPLYFAAGPYYLEGQGKVAWGGELRGAVDLYDYVRLEANTSYDSVFKWIGQGQISIMIPFGKKHEVKRKNGSSCSNAMALSRRAFQRVDRFEIIPTHNQHKKTKAIDPATGQPYVFWFVDNNSHSNGTFESPFTTLLAAQSASKPGDVIYVFPGDGTSTGMDVGITLKDNQKLFGASIPHTISTTMGSVTISTFATQLPLLVNGNGAVVTVQNNNEVSGLYIQNIFGDGITPLFAGITNLAATNNIIQGNVNFNGITLTSALGNTLISENIFNNEHQSIAISGSDVANATYSITKNNFSSTNTNGNLIELDFVDFSGTSCIISENFIHGASSFDSPSIGVTLNNSVVNTANSLVIQNNAINTSFDTIDISLSNDAMASISIMNNILNTEDGDGVNITLNNNSQANVTLTGNQMSVWLNALAFKLNDQSKVTLNVEDNTFIADNSGPVVFNLASSANLTGSFTNNIIEAYTDNSVFVLNEVGGSTSSLMISNNTFIGGFEDITARLNNSSQSKLSIIDNHIITPSFTGIILETFNSSQGKWIVSGNTITSFVQNGIFASSNDSSTTCLELVSNTSSPFPNAYSLNQIGGTFNLEPLQGNTGQVITSGTITPVPAGACQ